jgi:PKD repeat protein
MTRRMGTWYGRLAAFGCAAALLLAVGVSIASATANVLVMPNRDALLNVQLVVWGNTKFANGTAFDLDFGDGTAHFTGNVTDKTYIATTHTYTTKGLKTVTLTLGAESETAVVNVHDPADLSAFDLRNIKINIAIEDGLRFLYFNQFDRTSTPTTHWARACCGLAGDITDTSLSVLAFENHGHPPTNDPLKDIYQDVVQRGLNFIFDQLSIQTLTVEPAGDPCVGVPNDADKCKGLGQTSAFPTGYSTSIAVLAVTGANAPTRVVAGGLGANNGNFVAGKTYAEVIQRQINTVVWGAADNASVCGSDFNRGGFRYGLDDCQSDGSAIGWAVLAMFDAAAAGATVPAFAATELAFVIANTSCTAANGDIGLSYSGCGAGNVLRTGILLQALKFMNVAANDNRVVKATSFISNAWNAFHPDGESFQCSSAPTPNGPTTGSANNKGCAYAMFQVFKGLKLYGIQTLPGVTRAAGPGAILAGDWYEDYRDYLIQNQQNPTTTSGGQWASPQLFWSCCDDADVTGITALAELILSPVALITPTALVLAPATATNPVGTSHTVTATATANGQPVPGATITFTVTAGPNQGVTGQAVTDANGQATFTYQDAGGAGTDTIVASIGALTSNTVSKTWGSTPIPTLSEWAQILMMSLLVLIGLWTLRRRNGRLGSA